MVKIVDAKTVTICQDNGAVAMVLNDGCARECSVYVDHKSALIMALQYFGIEVIEVQEIDSHKPHTATEMAAGEFTLDTGGREHPVIHYVQDESTKENKQ